MINKFLKGNKKAVKTGFKWISLIFTTIVLIIFTIGFIQNQKIDLGLFIVVILSAGIGFPLFGISIGFLRWWRDFSVTQRNFSVFPFSQLDSLKFQRAIKNENSKTKFTSEYLTGKIGEFIVDCDVETQNENQFLQFKYYINARSYSNEDFERMQNEFEAQNGCFYFNWISKKYHYKNHRLKSVSELEKELINFSNLIHKEKIEPSDYAKR